MCDSCPKDCVQKFPSQKRTIVLTPEFLNHVGNTSADAAKIYLQLPFCVNECASNCNVKFCDFHFVAVCLKDHCRTTYVGLNDPACNEGELSENEERLFSLTQLPGTRVTLSRVGICLQNNNALNVTAENLWLDLKRKFGRINSQGEYLDWKGCLELCIEYWVECESCCTAEETVVPAVN